MIASSSRSTPDGAWAAQTSLSRSSSGCASRGQSWHSRAGEVRLVGCSGGHGDFSGGYGLEQAVNSHGHTLRAGGTQEDCSRQWDFAAARSGFAASVTTESYGLVRSGEL